jgi:hypothetical protein
MYGVEIQGRSERGGGWSAGLIKELAGLFTKGSLAMTFR